MSNLTIVVPAYNEEKSLRVFLPQLIDICGMHEFKLIIVNDASSDGTSDILDQFSDCPFLDCYSHKVNRGYGGAIKTGIRKAKTEFVITIDADGQHDMNDIPALFESIQSTGADMIVGNRMAHKDTSLYRSIGKSLIRWFARRLLPIHIEDINSGIKIYDTELAKRYIRLCPDHMAFSDIIAMVFISKQHLVLEQPVNILPRTDGTSTISTLTAFETVEEILNIVILFNPMRVFLPLALLAITLGAAWGLPIIIDGRGVSVGALLCFSTGMLFFCLGLVAEQLSQIRKSSVDD